MEGEVRNREDEVRKEGTDGSSIWTLRTTPDAQPSSASSVSVESVKATHVEQQINLLARPAA